MGFTDNFIAVIVASATAFSGSFSEVNITAAPDTVNSVEQANIDFASSLAQTSNASFGVAIIDRAKKNKIYTSGDSAHREFELGEMARLPILLYAARVDKKVAQGKREDIISMVQGASSEATDRAWKKYGGPGIIRDTAKRYNLQETKPGNNWNETTSSAVDIARLYRRFLDDKDVPVSTKKWVVSLLRKTSPTISGQDYTWGLPQAAGVGTDLDTDMQNKIGWMQGWSDEKGKSYRASTAILGEDMRYIVVEMGMVGDNPSPSTANDVASKVATALLTGDNGQSILGEEDDKDDAVEAFRESQAEKFGFKS